MREELTLPGNHCVVHGYHWPRPARTVKHHIIPESVGGPTNPGNLLMVCDTGHYNIHEYIDAVLKGKDTLPKIHKRERFFALLALEYIQGE